MLTKAIVEKIISPHEVKIRIPLFDSIEGSALATDPDDLTVATICTLPNCFINPKVGDIVFVGFEDNTTYKAVVLGFLCRDAKYETLPDLNVFNLNAEGHIRLSANTEIGAVSSSDILNMSGLKDSVQKQLDNLQDRITALESLHSSEEKT